MFLSSLSSNDKVSADALTQPGASLWYYQWRGNLNLDLFWSHNLQILQTWIPFKKGHFTFIGKWLDKFYIAFEPVLILSYANKLFGPVMTVMIMEHYFKNFALKRLDLFSTTTSWLSLLIPPPPSPLETIFSFV